MNFSKTSIIISAVLTAGIFPFSTAAKTKIINLLGSQFEIYETKKGDTFFGVAHEQGWNDSILTKYNPEVLAPFSKGEILVYPISDAYSNSDIEGNASDSFTADTGSRLNGISENGIYTLKPDDTLAGIARASGVSVESILDLNPGLMPELVLTGEKIKIPAPGSGIKKITEKAERNYIDSFKIHSVGNDDTWSQIAQNYSLDENLLKSANPDVVTLKKNQKLIIPMVATSTYEITRFERDDRESSESGIMQIYKDLHNRLDSKLKIAVLAESSSSKKDIEFLRGFLMALKAKNRDSFPVSLKVIDGSLPEDEIVSQMEQFAPNVIFTTFDKNIPTYFSEFALKFKTPSVNVFDLKDETYLTNPFIIQMIAPSAHFNERVADNIYSKFKDYKLVILGNIDENDSLAPELLKLWKFSEVSKLPELSLEPFSGILGEKVLFYGYPTKKDEVSEILKQVSMLAAQDTGADYKIIGRPNWILFDDLLKSDALNVETLIPSRFYLNDSMPESKVFYDSYNEMYNATPIKSVPLFAATGYETATYFIESFLQNDGDINMFKPDYSSLQTAFGLDRANNWSGFLNRPVFLVRYAPAAGGTVVERIVIE